VREVIENPGVCPGANIPPLLPERVVILFSRTRGGCGRPWLQAAAPFGADHRGEAAIAGAACLAAATL